MNLVEGVANIISSTSVRSAENATTANSIQKLLSDFANNENPNAIVSLTVQRRRFGKHSTSGRNIFDEETYELGFKHGQELSKFAYLGFERLTINYVIISPGTDLVITKQHKFAKSTTTLHNGTQMQQEKRWNFFKPLAFTIRCVQSNIDNIFNVHDPKFWDDRIWSAVGGGISIIIFLIVFIVALVNGNKSKSTFIPRLLTNDFIRHK